MQLHTVVSLKIGNVQLEQQNKTGNKATGGKKTGHCHCETKKLIIYCCQEFVPNANHNESKQN